MVVIFRQTPKRAIDVGITDTDLACARAGSDCVADVTLGLRPRPYAAVRFADS
jgi:hypothetical protein